MSHSAPAALSKIVMFLAWTAGAGAVAADDRPRPEPPTPPADTVTVRGRVLDPDGNPVKGARLYWPRMPKTPPRSEEDIEFSLRTKTDAEGRFRFELPRAAIKSEWGQIPLFAAADGYGADWAELPKLNAPAELTLRLVKDQPIEGRIHSTEGKPLAGVRVRAVVAYKPPQGRLDDLLAVWKQDWRSVVGQQKPPESMLLPQDEKSLQAVTDKEGRFRISGAGCDRFVLLRLRGPGIAPVMLFVVNRVGFDAAPVNKAVLNRIPAEQRLPVQPPLLYGPTIACVAPAARCIEGIVREAGSGKPVAGFRIHASIGYGDGIRAVSDKDGHYKLEGIPKRKQYLLTAWPPAKSSWLSTGACPEDAEGSQPIAVDFTVARGIVVRGRVIDRRTGKGVGGGIRFVPLPGNKFFGKPGYDFYKFERTTSEVDAEGRFQLAVLPGPGVLMFQAWGASETANGGQKLNPYKQAEFDAKDRERVKVAEKGGDRFFAAATNSAESLMNENAVKFLDLAAGAGTAKCDLFVERGATRHVRIEDADGQPLMGAAVAGVTAAYPNTFPIKNAICIVFALDPKKPRRLLFLHVKRHLAGTLTLRGDEKEPVVVRLGRAGAVTGRVLDRDGQPLSGADVNVILSDQSGFELYRVAQYQPTSRTDKDGRFRLEDIVPEMKFTLGIVRGRTSFAGEPHIGVRQVKPGETLDLGDLRVKPGP